MIENSMSYRVFLENDSLPPMYGIQGASGVRAGHISTDFHEVNQLAQCCNSAGLSPLHLVDVVEDFRRS